MSISLDRVTHGNTSYVPVTPLQLNQIGLILADKVLRSKWCPTWVVALWRGGVSLGVVVQEYLRRHDILTDHIPIRTSSYEAGVNGQQKFVAIHAATYVTNEMKAEDRILIVDDLQESGKTYLTIREFFAEKAKQRGIECPELRLAVGMRKLGKSTFDPDYHVVDVAGTDWIVLPHEIGDFKTYKGDDLLMRTLFPDTWRTLYALETGKNIKVTVDD